MGTKGIRLSTASVGMALAPRLGDRRSRPPPPTPAGSLFSQDFAAYPPIAGTLHPGSLEIFPMMMRELREKTKWVMIIVALSFVALMVFEWGMDISGRSVGGMTGELGRVNGDPVTYEAYTLVYQQLYQQAQAMSGGTQMTREQVKEIEDAAFNQVVNDLL